VPVLAVAGDEDVATPPALLEEIALGVQHGQLIILDQVAHLAAAEAPELVAELIDEHLSGRPHADAGTAAPVDTLRATYEAGMAVRREVILQFGGFDEALGPGSRFGSGDDWDITARALLKGWHVYESADLAIVHHGFRSFDEGRKHALRDWIAIGAVCAKPLRAGHWRAAVVPIYEFSVNALWPPVSDLLHGRKPRGLSRIRGFVQGFADGLRTPVDREKLLFRR